MFLKKSDTVMFDPSNKSHRQAVRDFMKRRAWVDTSIRFSYDPEYGSVVDQVQSKLLTWYMAKDNTAPRIRVPTPVASGMKLVKNKSDSGARLLLKSAE